MRSLAQLDIDRARGGAINPAAGAMPLADYADQWLLERPVALRPPTLELYEGLLRLHILPTFGLTQLNRITSAAVRSWHADLRRGGVADNAGCPSRRDKCVERVVRVTGHTGEPRIRVTDNGDG